MPTTKRIFSSEPLPIAPAISNVELEAFHRKVLDYLRRLAGKLDQFGGVPGPAGPAGPQGPPGTGGSGGVLVASGHLENDKLFSDTTPTPIEWDIVLRADSVFQFEPPTDFVKVLVAGHYVLMVDIQVFKNLPITTYVEAGGSNVGYGDGGHSISFPNHSCSIMCPLNLAANDEVKILIQSLPGSGDNTVLPTGTRFTLFYIAPEE